MYKYLLLFLLLMPFSTQAVGSYSWTDLNESCFEKSLKINISAPNDFLVELVKENDLFFISENKILASDIYSEGKTVFLDYRILNITGLANSKQEDLDLLNDNNQSTKLFFDNYNFDKKIIDLELNKSITANSFDFNFIYSRAYKAEYYISERGQNYTRVANPENFDFKFLRIELSNPDRDKVINQTLTVAEINFTQKAKVFYLVDNYQVEDVYVYAGFRCENKDLLNDVIEMAGQLVADGGFSTDINTKKYYLDLAGNPKYDHDFDGDYIPNNLDNCPFASNQAQTDTDRDLVGDACDFDNESKNFFDRDSDGDGVADSLDNCVDIFNPKQEDGNADRKGNLCSDDDRDGVIGHKDNCIKIANADQADININGVGDACEFDKDVDGIFDSVDNCISIYNPNQKDSDEDYIGDECDNCEIYNPRQIDENNNKIGDICEKKEENIVNNDKDGDRIIDSRDNCEFIANADQIDGDRDGVGDVCDNCLGIKNPKQEDSDKNAIGDMCEDIDADGLLAYLDNCPNHANPKQEDRDNDGVGDVCEDDDHDGVLAQDDNCPFVSNRDQFDTDGDEIGDKCDDQDNRFIESNKELFIGFIVLLTAIFGALIILMLRRIKANQEASNYDVEEIIEDVKE
jgi:hypothetical protein